MRAPAPRRSLVVLGACVTLLALLSCGGGEGSPLAPGDNEPPSDPPTQPADPDSATVTVGPQGGAVLLPDGAGVVFPAGAVSSPLAITVTRGDPARWFDGIDSTRAVLTTRASVSQFQHPVELRYPLPASATLADSANVGAGVVDDATGAVEMVRATVRLIDGKPFLVVSTDHFTNWILEMMVGKTPPPQAMLEVPWYGQGSSPFCWAASLHMVTQAARFEQRSSIPDIIGSVGVDEGGVGAVSFRMGDAIRDLVAQRSGVRPERKMWDYLNADLARDYMRREIGLHGRPVAVFNSRWEHAVVVVGYTGSTFYAHDPASTTPSTVGYKAKPWSEFTAGMVRDDKIVTLVVPGALQTARPPLAVNFLPGAVEFLKPSGGAADPSSLWVHGWDHTRLSGYAFRHSSSRELGAPLPGGVSTLRTRGEIQISNSSRTESQEVIVYLDVTAGGAPAGTGRLETERTVTVPPNAVVNLNVADIKVDTFRFNQAEVTHYTMTVTARVGSETVDRQVVEFSIAPVTPQVTAVTPAKAAVGAEVTLTGKGFGLLPMSNKVTFNGIQVDGIVSWADDAIKVVVPQGASDGPVVVTRGVVPSNEVAFSIARTTTLTGTVSTVDEAWIEGIRFDVSMSWALSGLGPALKEHNTQINQRTFTVARGEAASFTVDLSGSYTPSRKYYPGGNWMEIKEMSWGDQTVAQGSVGLQGGVTGSRLAYTFTLRSGADLVCFTPRIKIKFDYVDKNGVVTSRDHEGVRNVGAQFCVNPSP